ncbi:MAG: ABC transporter permease subunit [Dehalococcoidia bacterium]
MAIFWKELSDHFSSKRFIILFLLIYLAGIAAIYMAGQYIRTGVTDSTQFIFMRLYTVQGGNLPSFPFFLAIFIPIVGIALGFDSINSERVSGNLSRVLSQPLYRDAVVNGKFLAGLATMTILIVSIVAVVGGMGLRMIGVPPTAEEILRIFGFIFLSVLYGAFWMSLSVLFSILFNRTATSVLASIALWIFLTLLLGIIAGFIANAVVPIDETSSEIMRANNYTIYSIINRISPGTLYSEAIGTILLPEIGSLSYTGIVLRATGVVSGTLSLRQSLLVIWPQVTALIGLTAICFAVSYIRFMREEIRAT